MLEDDPAVRPRCAHGPPSTVIAPAVGRWNPASSESSVDLPQPDGPTIADELAGADLEVERAERVDLGPAPATVDVADAVEEHAHRAATASANPALTASE